MEGYILGGRNIPEHAFRKEFKEKHGQRQLLEHIFFPGVANNCILKRVLESLDILFAGVYTGHSATIACQLFG